TPAARVRCPAVTPPALQRQKKIKPSTVGYSGDFGYILPPRTPPLRHLCHCDSATRIQRKEAKQETMGVRQTGSQPALCHPCPRADLRCVTRATRRAGFPKTTQYSGTSLVPAAAIPATE